jgi:peptide/nickel transport system ATP-binding protein/oligopeptide transport system ATP-binding protein
MSRLILEIKDLKTRFSTKKGLVPAVDGVNIKLYKGETHGLVGESGCGKSVTALSVLGLVPKPHGHITGGEILFNEEDLTKASKSRMSRIRGNDISMIFQEPMTSLNPVYTVGFQIEEVLKKHRNMKKAEARQEAVKVLSLVGIPDPENRLDDYPHQMSGGMRQRVMIAMALSCHPQVMIADEPTTALDVTIQAQILELINRLKKEIDMSVLLITHDLGVVAETCQWVSVMYAGKVVESAETKELFANPRHPYTVGLFSSLPKIGGKEGELKTIPGVVPGLLDLPPGCAFQDRCFKAGEDCRKIVPWREISSGHMVRCVRPVE